MAKQGKTHDRAQGETQITISLPRWLRDELTRLAQEDDRSRSKWIVRELARIVDRKKAFQVANIEQMPLAAEKPDAPYGHGKDHRPRR